MNKLVEVDTGCAEFGAEMVPWVDENNKVILADGAAKEQDVKCVPSVGNTPKEVIPERDEPFDKIDDFPTSVLELEPTDASSPKPTNCSVYTKMLEQAN